MIKTAYTKRLTILFLSSLILAVLWGCAEGEEASTTLNASPPALDHSEQGGAHIDENQSEHIEAEENEVETGLTRPPLIEEEPAPIDWITGNLELFGLDSSEEEEELPIGEDICSFVEPDLLIDHPFASQGSNGRRPIEASREVPSQYHLPPAQIAHPEMISTENDRLSPAQSRRQAKLEGIELPSHVNDFALDTRAEEWDESRCYQLGPFDERLGATSQAGTLLNQEEAYDLYRRLVHTTLWRDIDQTPGQRSVIGIRGAYPGSFKWHHNAPNQYNDTLVLLWRDENAKAHVREFFVNTDTGAHDFGADNSSSLRPNRHYPYINGWHRDYHALQIDLSSYPVRDDTNNNGHWDSDRNGWLEGPEEGRDYDRLGSGHNIHAGNENGSVSDALINIASAGCQVIPGLANWLVFIENAWTGLGDEVDYFLIDARDISPRFWKNCAQADGSHACPWQITSFPFTHQADTSLSEERWHDVYQCDDANEAGAELMYVLNLPTAGTLRATLTTNSEEIDPDLHLLEGDDARACRTRGHQEIETRLPPGRYLLVVDTWVNASGVELAGRYDLRVDWSPSP